MQREREETYEHTAKAMTVGELRADIAGVPDDAALLAVTAEMPGGDTDGESQVVISAGMGPGGGAAGRLAPGVPNADQRFELGLEFPSGSYSRFSRGREEAVEHTVRAWTVGELRAALAGVPDDVDLVAVTAEEPGGTLAGPDQVVYASGIGEDWVPPVRGKHDGYWTPVNRYELRLEFPTGTYSRYITEDDDDF
jgi:hypothetical protein